MNYIIEYKVELITGTATGKIRVKNQLSELNAKVNLERYLIKKHINFKRLYVKSCREDNIFGGLFNDIFKS